MRPLLLALVSLTLVSIGCGSNRGGGGGDDDDETSGGDSCALGSSCSPTSCVCSDGSVIDVGARCDDDGDCMDPSAVCSDVCSSSTSGAGATGSSGSMTTSTGTGGGATTSTSGSGAAGTSGGDTSASASSGSGGYDPLCVAAADNYCESCPPDPTSCKGSEAWQTYAECYLKSSCPGMYECIASAPSCEAMQGCECSADRAR